MPPRGSPSQRLFNVSYYWRNRTAEIERVVSRQRATLEWLRDLRRVPCLECGGTFPPHVMDFDHRDPRSKSFSVAAGRALLKSRAVLAAEIAKCDIVCGNCHRIRTAAQYARGDLEYGFKTPEILKPGVPAERHRNRWRTRRQQQMDLLERIRQLPCFDCGRTYPTCAMELDHRDPSLKRGLPSQMAGRVRMRTLLEEIAKCDIVCTNCHRDRSYRQRVHRGSSTMASAPAFQAGYEGSIPFSRSEILQPGRSIEERPAKYFPSAA